MATLLPGVIPRDRWGARHEPDPRKVPQNVREVVLHHTGEGSPIHLDPSSRMRWLEDIGHERFGKTVSYNFVVMPDGMTFEGCPVDHWGTHTKNHNKTARAIVLFGDYRTNAPTDAQVAAVARLLADGHEAGLWSTKHITHGHRELVGTECPGNAGFAAIARINSFVEDDMPLSDDDVERIVDRWNEKYGERLAAYLAGRPNAVYNTETVGPPPAPRGN